MYIALFFVPWLLGYATTAFVMNHREFFQIKFDLGKVDYVLERGLACTGMFPEDAGPNTMAEQLSDLPRVPAGALRTEGGRKDPLNGKIRP